MHHGIGHCVAKSAVALIEVEVIVFVKVVADVDIRPPVVVEVAGSDAEAVSDHGVVDVGFCRDVHVLSVVVPQQLVACHRVRLSFKVFSGAKSPVLMQGMVELEHVEVAVEVEVEERCLGRKAGQIEVVINGFVFVSGDAIFNAFAYEQLVAPFDALVVAQLAHVEVKQAVVVDVHDADTGRPAIHACHTCFFGHVFELEAALVEEHLVRAHVVRKIQIHKTVVVEVACAHTAAVEKVHVVEHVESAALAQFVCEFQPGGVFAKQLKEGRGLLGTIASEQQTGQQHD